MLSRQHERTNINPMTFGAIIILIWQIAKGRYLACGQECCMRSGIWTEAVWLKHGPGTFSTFALRPPFCPRLCNLLALWHGTVVPQDPQRLVPMVTRFCRYLSPFNQSSISCMKPTNIALSYFKLYLDTHSTCRWGLHFPWSINKKERVVQYPFTLYEDVELLLV